MSFVGRTLRKVADMADGETANRRQINEAALARAEQDALRKATIRAEDLRWLLSTSNGRRFLYQTLDVCGLMGEGWDKDARATDFLQGRRSVAVALARELVSVDAAGFQQMQAEGFDAARNG